MQLRRKTKVSRTLTLEAPNSPSILDEFQHHLVIDHHKSLLYYSLGLDWMVGSKFVVNLRKNEGWEEDEQWMEFCKINP